MVLLSIKVIRKRKFIVVYYSIKLNICCVLQTQTRYLLYTTVSGHTFVVVYYNIGPDICGVLQYLTGYLLWCTTISDRIFVVVYYSIWQDIFGVLLRIQYRGGFHKIYKSIEVTKILVVTNWLTVMKHLFLKWFFGGVRVVHWFVFCFVGFHSVSSVQCCLCLLIVHSWLPLRL